MKRVSFFIIIPALVLISLPLQFLNAQSVLWSIGIKDHNYSEFACAGEGYRSFSADGFFVPGVSEASSDWPFVHPGPIDGWAGNRPHSFSILFGISETTTSGENCRLVIAMVDTHKNDPGSVELIVNGHKFVQGLPKGYGDESVNGQPEKGKAYECVFEFPSGILKKGHNELEINKSTGSWFLYDALIMEAPEGFTPGPAEEILEIAGCSVEPAVRKIKGNLVRILSMDIKYAGRPKKITWLYNDSQKMIIDLLPGRHKYTCTIPEPEEEQEYTCSLVENNLELAVHSGSLSPAGKKTIYILPHSHTDIGYTDIQTAIEDRQVENLRTGIRYAMETAGYPEGARFVWNVEVSWAADLYLNRLGDDERWLFNEALEKGWISLNGMYLNELTGLCRPEELLRLFKYSTKLARETGVVADAAMISDVPGYTWGTVTAMAQAGIKYFSVAPNYFDRIGDILVQWENKPFYWVGPSGKEKVLVWIPFKGYAWSHTINELNEQHASVFLEQLDKMDYPYNIAYMRWSGHGDNAVPEKQISDFVKSWNEEYAWPRFVISSTGQAFRAFEEKYGDQLEEYSGDWTPYWEDGAGSSALETAMNRNSADRLTQAEALFAMAPGAVYPVPDFEKAWQQALLYSEHTWGAWCSITDPENTMTIEQWEIKKSYAGEADRMSRELLGKNLDKASRGKEIELINTTAWGRKEPVILDKKFAEGIHGIINTDGQALPVQRLSTGELLFIPDEAPAFSSSSYILSAEPAKATAGHPTVKVSGRWVLDNGILQVMIDPETGDIRSLSALILDNNLAPVTGHSLNQYLFFEGDNINDLKTSGQADIRIIEAGPVYALIEARSEAPGCNSLIRRYKLAMGSDYLEIENIVDKKRAPMPGKIGDWFLAQNRNKESVNFAFPFSVENGVMRLDLPIGSIVPWEDQIPSACKNWFTAGRYTDISNEDYGITWFTLDAPLVEVGGITANLVGSQTNPEVWRKSVEPTQELYSWAMNNHWGTNYRQYQEGPVTFRYALRPHKVYDAAATYRLATGMSQPLLVSSRGNTYRPPVQLESEGIVLFSLKPADDGNGCIARLYNPGKNARRGTIITGGQIWVSNTAEGKIHKIQPDIELKGMELMTVRIE